MLTFGFVPNYALQRDAGAGFTRAQAVRFRDRADAGADAHVHHFLKQTNTIRPLICQTNTIHMVCWRRLPHMKYRIVTILFHIILIYYLKDWRPRYKPSYATMRGRIRNEQNRQVRNKINAGIYQRKAAKLADRPRRMSLLKIYGRPQNRACGG